MTKIMQPSSEAFDTYFAARKVYEEKTRACDELLDELIAMRQAREQMRAWAARARQTDERVDRDRQRIAFERALERFEALWEPTFSELQAAEQLMLSVSPFLAERQMTTTIDTADAGRIARSVLAK